MIDLHRNTPTLDIYFRGPLSDLISPFAFTTPARPILRIGPNAFVCGQAGVIVRYVTPQELRQLVRAKLASVYYVVDDDFFSLDADSSLPDDYRRRLAQFAERTLPRILAMADTVVSPSEIILERFGDKRCEVLAPAYVSVAGDFDHFDGRVVRAIFPGTRSHLSDLEAIAPALLEAVETHRQLTVTTYLGKYGAGVLVACLA